MVRGMDTTEAEERGAHTMDLDRIAYTVKDTARLLSLSQRKVRYLIATGELPSIKVGAARRVHGSAIREYAERVTTSTGNAS